MERILYRFPGGCAVCEDGRLVEYIDLSDESQSGDIVFARVARMMRGMECAFADIGRKKDGFLPLKENSSSFTEGPVRSGDLIPVQIRREETGEKGAFLSRDLSIPGKTLILMPRNRHIGISRRITDEKTREKLLECGKRIAGGKYGLVMRAESAHTPEKEIRMEAEELESVWLRLQDAIGKAGKPGDVLYEQDPLKQLIRDYAVPESAVIPAEEMPAGLRRQLSAADDRIIRLPGGGNIVIDRCEAMTVIDVNTAAVAPAGDKEATVTATNLEASVEAAIRIRLKDIAGIIMIDFIDMVSEDNRNRITEKMREMLGRDRRKTVIHGWTKLGIMELTRKRI